MIVADFYKYHGLGNDYLVIDPKLCKVKMEHESIKLICHRNYGLGSDGILYGPFKREGKTFFHIYNPDGSEAEKSGNGIRIFAQYLLDQGYEKNPTFELLTLGGEVKIELLDAQTNLLRVDMGNYSFHSQDVPVAGVNREVIAEDLKIFDQDFQFTAVTVGNPHAVVHLQEVSEESTRFYGAAFETHELFPNRINVQFVKAIDKHTIQIEIWERGAGYTLASGSSSCAAAIASIKRGFVQSPVTVRMPGGQVKIEEKAGHLFLTGTVEGVYSGSFHSNLAKKLNINVS